MVRFYCIWSDSTVKTFNFVKVCFGFWWAVYKRVCSKYSPSYNSTEALDCASNKMTHTLNLETVHVAILTTLSKYMLISLWLISGTEMANKTQWRHRI